MCHYKIFIASFLGLVLVGINARADDAPVIDLNSLPDDSVSFSQSSGTSSEQVSTSNTIAARQSLPMAERVRLLEQQLNNLTQMNLPGKIDSLEQQINQLNGQIEEQTHTISQLQSLQKQPVNTPKSAADVVTEIAIAKQSTPADTSSLPDEVGIDKPSPPPAVTPPVTTLKVKNPNTPTNEAVVSPPNPIVIAETAVVQNKPSTKNTTKTDTVTSTVSDEKAYQAAFDLMLKKKNTAAITAFKAFLKNYPNSTNYVPSAHYWLGELYLAGNMNALAGKEFSAVIQQYPTHTKVPDAMFKLAIIHDDAGQHAQAKQELQKVIKQFPNSTAAKLAKMRLQAM